MFESRIVRRVDPKLYGIESVSKLPKGSPYGIFDLDGTLTEPGHELLLASFVKNPDNSDFLKEGSAERQKLLNCFEDYREGKKVYEPYLTEIGELWAEMLAATEKTRAQVMEQSESWFNDIGHREVMPYAIPMMDELKRHRFNRMMVTGAPCEIAQAFAAHIGIEHVFSMMAEVDGYDKYTGKMRKRHNTGLLSNKASICREAMKRCAFGIAAGDTQSDTVLADTAIYANAANPDDIEGYFFLMNPRSEVLARMEASRRNHFDTGRIQVVRWSDTTEFTMRKFRNALRDIFLENQELRPLLHEIEDTMPRSEVRRIWTLIEESLSEKTHAKLMEKLRPHLPHHPDLQKTETKVS